MQQLTRRQHTLDSGKRLWNLNHLICWLTKQHKNTACAEEWAAIRPKDSPGECFYCPHGVKCAFILMNRSVNKAHSAADESLRRRHTHLTHTDTLRSQHTHTHLASHTAENVRHTYGTTLLSSTHIIYHLIK